MNTNKLYGKKRSDNTVSTKHRVQFRFAMCYVLSGYITNSIQYKFKHFDSQTCFIKSCCKMQHNIFGQLRLLH